MKVRYVYYNKFSGQILEILRDKKRGSAPYIECDAKEVIPLIKGTKGINDLIVAYDKKDEKHKLVEKDNIIRLRNLGHKLYKIPYKKKGNFDLRLLIYEKSNVLEVTLDPTNFSSLFTTNFREQVKFEKGTEIRIFIKNKIGKKLQKTIVINGQEILDKGQLFYDISDIDLKDISFYTNQMFEKYIWYRGKSRFLSPIKDRIQFDINKADSKKQHEDFSYHLEIKRLKKGLEIKNNIDDPQLVKIFDPVEFFIVDKLDPNILYDGFELDLNDLKSKLILVPVSVDNGKAILYNHKYISVLFED